MEYGLQQCLCDPYGLTVTVCHYPSGASKYNPIVIYTGFPSACEVTNELVTASLPSS
jgi:hypothetical protein